MGYIRPDKNDMVKCSVCNGKGYVGDCWGLPRARHPDDDTRSFFPKKTCGACNGSGKVLYYKDEEYMYLARKQKK